MPSNGLGNCGTFLIEQVKTAHVFKVALGKAPPELLTQLVGQCLEHRFAISRPLLALLLMFDNMPLLCPDLFKSPGF